VGEPSHGHSVREVLRRLPRRSYALTKWRLLRRMERAGGDPVVVFCMSKTASSAIVRGLRDALDRPVYKIHLLRPESVARAEADYRRTDPSARPRHILHAAHLLRHLPTAAAPWDVVTIVREPLARSASDFFQSGQRWGRLGDADQTTAAFQRFAAEQGVPRTTDWFDRELLPSLGVDVYDHPFDPDVGVGVIEAPAVRLLILRHESLAAAPGALAAFLGRTEDVRLPRENVGARKDYSELYEQVLRDVRFDVATLDLAYESRFARHFYTDAERAELRQRWGHGTGSQ
jgi:Putative capsular polysaccharide synthesis protein